MSSSSVTTPATALGTESADRAFRVAFGLYAGAILGGLAATGAALTTVPPSTIAVTAVTAFLVGTSVAVALAGRLRGLPVRLGRAWPRQLAVVCVALPFLAAAVASLLGPLESRLGLVALGSAVAVAIAGLVVARAAENRAVDLLTDSDPIASWRWRWTPGGYAALDLAVVLVWSALAVSDAVGGDWGSAIVWAGLAGLVAVISVAEGRWTRWLPGPSSESAEIRCYEHGLVTVRPYRRQFIAWKDVDHVRLRGTELVVDHGLFDRRFDRADLEDPDAVLEAIDRQLDASAGR